MKIAGRFKPCIHMGCFDLDVFVEMKHDLSDPLHCDFLPSEEFNCFCSGNVLYVSKTMHWRISSLTLISIASLLW
jgi:hypothetical protein